LKIGEHAAVRFTAVDWNNLTSNQIIGLSIAAVLGLLVLAFVVRLYFAYQRGLTEATQKRLKEETAFQAQLATERAALGIDTSRLLPVGYSSGHPSIQYPMRVVVGVSREFIYLLGERGGSFGTIPRNMIKAVHTDGPIGLLVAVEWQHGQIEMTTKFSCPNLPYATSLISLITKQES
jgi:hypothetical protein